MRGSGTSATPSNSGTGCRGCGSESWTVVCGRGWRGGSPRRPSCCRWMRLSFVDRHVAPTAHRIGPVPLDRLVDEAIGRFMPAEAEARRLEHADGRYFTVESRQVHSFDGTLAVHGELDLADALELETAIQAVAAQLKELGSTESLDVRRSMAVGELARREFASTWPIPVGEGAPRPSRNHPARSCCTSTCPRTPDRPGRTGQPADHPRPAGSVRGPAGGREAGPRPDRPRPGRHTGGAGPAPRGDRGPRPDLRVPWCTRPARSCDADHVVPSSRGGPTCPCNEASLCRRHHRVKTFTGWTYTAVDAGAYLWSSPHGYSYLRDKTGTQDTTRHQPWTPPHPAGPAACPHRPADRDPHRGRVKRGVAPHTTATTSRRRRRHGEPAATGRGTGSRTEPGKPGLDKLGRRWSLPPSPGFRLVADAPHTSTTDGTAAEPADRDPHRGRVKRGVAPKRPDRNRRRDGARRHGEPAATGRGTGSRPRTRPCPASAASTTSAGVWSPRCLSRQSGGGAYLGSTSSASMPRSSATCSTTTVSTIASRSVRFSQRCSIGPPEEHEPGRGGAGPADQRRERHRVGVPVVGDLRGVLDGVLHQAEPVLPAPVDVGDDVEGELVEALAGGAAGRTAGQLREDRGPRMPRPRRSRGALGAKRLPQPRA